VENALARPLIRSDIFKALQEEKSSTNIQNAIRNKKQ
jgi:hypothetical protein